MAAALEAYLDRQPLYYTSAPRLTVVGAAPALCRPRHVAQQSLPYSTPHLNCVTSPLLCHWLVCFVCRYCVTELVNVITCDGRNILVSSTNSNNCNVQKPTHGQTVSEQTSHAVVLPHSTPPLSFVCSHLISSHLSLISSHLRVYCAASTKTLNLILDDTHERVLSPSEPVTAHRPRPVYRERRERGSDRRAGCGEGEGGGGGQQTRRGHQTSHTLNYERCIQQQALIAAIPPASRRFGEEVKRQTMQSAPDVMRRIDMRVKHRQATGTVVVMKLV